MHCCAHTRGYLVVALFDQIVQWWSDLMDQRWCLPFVPSHCGPQSRTNLDVQHGENSGNFNLQGLDEQIFFEPVPLPLRPGVFKWESEENFIASHTWYPCLPGFCFLFWNQNSVLRFHPNCRSPLMSPKVLNKSISFQCAPSFCPVLFSALACYSSTGPSENFNIWC